MEVITLCLGKKNLQSLSLDKKKMLPPRGENNPQFGVIKSEETLTKLRKKVYVYDSFTKNLLIEYKGTVECMKKHPIGKGTFAKYIDSGISFKGQLFYRLPRF